jgi:hypothetical protein
VDLVNSVRNTFSTWAMPRPAPVEPAQSAAPTVGDRMQLSTTAGMIASLKAGADFKSFGRDQWQALGNYVMGLPSAQQEALVRDLQRSEGPPAVTLQTWQGRVTFASEGFSATVEPATQRVKVTRDNVSEIYRNGKLEVKLTRDKDETVTVERAGVVQRWNLPTGKGTTADGQPILPREAAPVPGEAPRGPWNPQMRVVRERPVDRNHPYDQTAVEAGGARGDIALTVSETRSFNCHSYSLTGGKGDLADPFSTPGDAWLNPQYQLATGAFTHLGPEQRVHPGDIIVYSDANGRPKHSGIVREVDADGNPSRVESKWSGFDVFTHPPFTMPSGYGTVANFYRPD